MRRRYVEDISHVTKERERERHKKPQHVVSYLTTASSLRFQQGKACGVRKRVTPRHDAPREKSGLKKAVGGNARRPCGGCNQRRQSRQMKERPKGLYEVRWLAASAGEARARPREGRARGREERRKMRGTERGVPARFAGLHNAPRLHPA